MLEAARKFADDRRNNNSIVAFKRYARFEHAARRPRADLGEICPRLETETIFRYTHRFDYVKSVTFAAKWSDVFISQHGRDIRSVTITRIENSLV